MSPEERSRLLLAASHSAEAAAHLLLVPGLYQAAAEEFIRHSRELSAFAAEMAPKVVGKIRKTSCSEWGFPMHAPGSNMDCPGCREIREDADRPGPAPKPVYERPTLERVQEWEKCKLLPEHQAGSIGTCWACIETRKGWVSR